MDVEVPWLAVVRVVHNNVEGEARREEFILGSLNLGSDSRRKLELGDDRLRLEVSNTAQKFLREHIVLVRLQRAEA